MSLPGVFFCFFFFFLLLHLVLSQALIHIHHTSVHLICVLSSAHSFTYISSLYLLLLFTQFFSVLIYCSTILIVLFFFFFKSFIFLQTHSLPLPVMVNKLSGDYINVMREHLLLEAVVPARADYSYTVTV